MAGRGRFASVAVESLVEEFVDLLAPRVPALFRGSTTAPRRVAVARRQSLPRCAHVKHRNLASVWMALFMQSTCSGKARTSLHAQADLPLIEVVH